ISRSDAATHARFSLDTTPRIAHPERRGKPMPVFCARWPNGSFSIVEAGDLQEAYVRLDEFGPEPAAVWPLASCAMDFGLTDEGSFQLLQIGEDMEEELLEKAYPALLEAYRAEVLVPDAADPAAMAAHDAEAEQRMRKAVDAERQRCAGVEEQAPSTLIGRDLQQRVSGSGRFIDGLVYRVAG